MLINFETFHVDLTWNRECNNEMWVSTLDFYIPVNLTVKNNKKPNKFVADISVMPCVVFVQPNLADTAKL